MDKLSVEGFPIDQYDILVCSRLREYEDVICESLEICVRRIDPPQPPKPKRNWGGIMRATLALFTVAIVTMLMLAFVTWR
jgi:hypothetical protein